MGDRKTVLYSYQNTEAFQEFESTVNEVIKEDTGESDWTMLEDDDFLPRGISPPLSEEAIEKIKSIDGILVMVDDAN